MVLDKESNPRLFRDLFDAGSLIPVKTGSGYGSTVINQIFREVLGLYIIVSKILVVNRGE
jgi:hypothetical protein